MANSRTGTGSSGVPAAQVKFATVRYVAVAGGSPVGGPSTLRTTLTTNFAYRLLRHSRRKLHDERVQRTISEMAT